tara:strand:+ start:85 stop:507 length:423 start_codon:yes stop_codon:yes gene_type:complete
VSSFRSTIFHLAFTVTDLAAAHAFYTFSLGCSAGKMSDDWIVFDFFGHKATAYLDRNCPANGPVHDDDPDKRHFGVILDAKDFHELAERLGASAQKFTVPPTHQNAGTDNEHWIMMLKDPAGNTLEFNSVLNREKIFMPG